MDKRKSSVIASFDDVELVDIVRQGILENDCYRLASDMILTSEQNRTSRMKDKSLKHKLDLLKTFTTRL